MHLTNHAVNRCNMQARSLGASDAASDDEDNSNSSKWTFATLR